MLYMLYKIVVLLMEKLEQVDVTLLLLNVY